MKIAILISLLVIAGCVERRLIVISDPPKARVLLDGKDIGTTPLNILFDFYGTREITLYKKGYHIQSRMEKISTPAYQIFPVDFFSEFVIPFTIEDEHRLEYTLKPQTPILQEQKKRFIERGNILRKEIE